MNTLKHQKLINHSLKTINNSNIQNNSNINQNNNKGKTTYKKKIEIRNQPVESLKNKIIPLSSNKLNILLKNQIKDSDSKKILKTHKSSIRESKEYERKNHFLVKSKEKVVDVAKKVTISLFKKSNQKNNVKKTPYNFYNKLQETIGNKELIITSGTNPKTLKRNKTLIHNKFLTEDNINKMTFACEIDLSPKNNPSQLNNINNNEVVISSPNQVTNTDLLDNSNECKQLYPMVCIPDFVIEFPEENNTNHEINNTNILMSLKNNENKSKMNFENCQEFVSITKYDCTKKNYNDLSYRNKEYSYLSIYNNRTKLKKKEMMLKNLNNSICYSNITKIKNLPFKIKLEEKIDEKPLSIKEVKNENDKLIKKNEIYKKIPIEMVKFKRNKQKLEKIISIKRFKEDLFVNWKNNKNDSKLGNKKIIPLSKHKRKNNLTIKSNFNQSNEQSKIILNKSSKNYLKNSDEKVNESDEKLKNSISRKINNSLYINYPLSNLIQSIKRNLKLDIETQDTIHIIPIKMNNEEYDYSHFSMEIINDMNFKKRNSFIKKYDELKTVFRNTLKLLSKFIFNLVLSQNYLKIGLINTLERIEEYQIINENFIKSNFPDQSFNF